MSTPRTPSTVLAVVAHADDEALGAAGTLRLHVDAGDAVYVLSMTDGVSSRGQDTAAATRRAAAAAAAAEAVGFAWLPGADFADNAMDSHALVDIVRVVEAAKRKLDPDVVYTHFPGDLNVDHQRTARAALTAFRPQPGERHREILAFEVASSTDWFGPTHTFAPDTFVDISGVWDAKRAALEAYREEMRAAPHARSFEGVDALARHRGATVGFERAEAFVTLRRRLTGRLP